MGWSAASSWGSCDAQVSLHSAWAHSLRQRRVALKRLRERISRSSDVSVALLLSAPDSALSASESAAAPAPPNGRRPITLRHLLFAIKCALAAGLWLGRWAGVFVRWSVRGCAGARVKKVLALAAAANTASPCRRVFGERERCVLSGSCRRDRAGGRAVGARGLRGCAGARVKKVLKK